MRKLQKKSFYPLCALVILLFATHGYGLAATSSRTLLPDNLIVEDGFKPGLGLPVGRVQLVQGEVVIIHADQMRGYLAKRDLLLFKNDTIVTKEKGRIRIKLNDASVMTLASQTKLKISQSVYDPAKKVRSSFISMALGKARFWAKKFMNYKQSLFRVKTQTAVVGVRGSEWVEEVTQDSTKVTALEDTVLEVVSTAAPEIEPTVVEDFQQTIVDAGELPSGVVAVSVEEIEQLKKEFTVTPEGEETGAKVEVQKEKQEKKEAVAEAGAEPTPAGEESSERTMGAGEKPAVEGDAKEVVATKKETEKKKAAAVLVPGMAADVVLVPEDELVDPVPIITEEIETGFDMDTVIEEIETDIAQEEIVNTDDEVIEEAPPEPTDGSITINW